MQKTITIRDVAKRAGVGISTVSRVVNGGTGVNEATQERVRAIIAECGYAPNSNARQLKQRRADAAAVIVRGAGSMFLASVLELLQPRIEALGLRFLAHYIDEHDDEAAAARAIHAEKKVRGIVLLGGSVVGREDQLDLPNVPCVYATLDARTVHAKNVFSVSVDDRAAAKVMIEHMYKQGRRRIGIIGDRPDCSRPSQQRLDGCLEAMQQLGLPFDFDKQYGYARFSMEESYAAAEYLLAHCPDLDAVFAMSDLMALGAVRAFQDHGLRVPQDIGVAGYDGISLGRFTVPRLTTIRQNTALLSQRAAQILLASIEHNAPAVHEVVPFELILGESV